jgi:hypothetical protein
MKSITGVEYSIVARGVFGSYTQADWAKKKRDARKEQKKTHGSRLEQQTVGRLICVDLFRTMHIFLNLFPFLT